MTLQVAIGFRDIRAERPNLTDLRTAYHTIGTRFDRSESAEERAGIVREWDTLRRGVETWSTLTTLHFEQDSRNSEYQAERKIHDEMTPKLTALDIEMKRRLVATAHRAELEREFGSHVFSTWEVDISAFDSVIEPDLVDEARLTSEYTAIIASAEISFQGETRNLAALEPFMKVADREVRHRAQAARWDFYAGRAEELDRIYDELVRTRQRMARKLGYDNFVGLAYKRMKRLDYNEHDVTHYREQVIEHIVPIAETIVRDRAARLGLGEAMFWDESLHDEKGNPRPLGGHDWLLRQGSATFQSLHPELGEFFEMMVRGELLDVLNRPGKAGGGFCANFPSYGLPFVFANFNGTEHDVVVLLHEMGHAFQNYSSRNVKLYDNILPTYETAEVHSMAMEFLCFHEMERFFGDDAARFREHHLAEALMFIPYGCAVDHFQHLVYEKPQASANERHEIWQQLERLYMPWRKYGDLAFPAKGALWQEKRHIYLSPFYYIDYTLAQCCALQFWVRAKSDFAATLSDYIALCAKGGTAAFATLIRSANLRSPFEEGTLAGVADAAKAELRI